MFREEYEFGTWKPHKDSNLPLLPPEPKSWLVTKSTNSPLCICPLTLRDSHVTNSDQWLWAEVMSLQGLSIEEPVCNSLFFPLLFSNEIGNNLLCKQSNLSHPKSLGDQADQRCFEWEISSRRLMCLNPWSQTVVLFGKVVESFPLIF